MQSLLPFHSGAKAERDFQVINLTKKLVLKNHPEIHRQFAQEAGMWV